MFVHVRDQILNGPEIYVAFSDSGLWIQFGSIAVSCESNDATKAYADAVIRLSPGTMRR